MRTEKRQSESSKSHILWAALGLLAFVLALYARLLFTNRVLASGDILHYFYPYRDYAAEAFRSGRIPLWNPFTFLGAPFLANPQAAVLYPLHWPLSWLPVTKQIYWSAALHTWLLGFGGYLLMRRWRYRRPAGLCHRSGAGGQRFLRRPHRPHQPDERRGLVALAGAGHRNCRRRSPKAPPGRSATTLGASGRRLFRRITALMLLAGHTQTAYINLFAVGIWTVWPLVSMATFRQPRQQLAQRGAGADGLLRRCVAGRAHQHGSTAADAGTERAGSAQRRPELRRSLQLQPQAVASALDPAAQLRAGRSERRLRHAWATPSLWPTSG